jgi:hypothetical protein
MFDDWPCLMMYHGRLDAEELRNNEDLLARKVHRRVWVVNKWLQYCLVWQDEVCGTRED